MLKQAVAVDKKKFRHYMLIAVPVRKRKNFEFTVRQQLPG